MDAIQLCDIIKVYTNIYVNTQQYCLTQFYYYLESGEMFRLLIQPSSGQLTIEQELLCAHNMGSHTVYIYSTCNINISVKPIIIWG